MNRDKIIDRLKKLSALATKNTVQAEMQSAAAECVRLLAENGDALFGSAMNAADVSRLKTENDRLARHNQQLARDNAQIMKENSQIQWQLLKKPAVQPAAPMPRTKDDKPKRRVIMSKYPGHCAECGEPFEVGDMISWMRGDATFHADCVVGEARL